MTQVISDCIGCNLNEMELGQLSHCEVESSLC